MTSYKVIVNADIRLSSNLLFVLPAKSVLMVTVKLAYANKIFKWRPCFFLSIWYEVPQMRTPQCIIAALLL